ncbi:MAG: 3-hydroxyacyl-ACP dehydratase FabZ family protein [Candidatus Moranbacteria bacterium]|nr:3-hydroxyacyl-ACP dehydratase FabZ family protein [Candidatus Moranbacteria bacterium]
MQKKDQCIILDKEWIKFYLPHRELALVLDSAIYDPAVKDKLIATKKLSAKDPYFKGHFPGKPVLPGHWQLEFICLAGAVLCGLMFPAQKGYPTLTGFEGMKLRRPIIPGDIIEIKVQFLRQEIIKNTHYFLSGAIFLRGKKASSVEEIHGVLIT